MIRKGRRRDGSGVERCVEDLNKTYPALNFVPGRLLNGRLKEDALKAWAESLKY